MAAHHNAQMVVLVPARRIEPGLAPMIGALSGAGFGAIVIVNDGMPDSDVPEFEALAAIPRVHLLKHAINLGKGRALKTGFNYVLDTLTEFAGLITADADGQHAVRDILRVAATLQAHPQAVVLGCRNFNGPVPLRSRFGNAITRSVFQFFSGRRVSDTQTGLRAFPLALLRELLALPGERYEYEMTVLAHLSRHAIPLIEVPIQTIYIDDNRSSSFNPLRDSMRIYFVLARFYASSLVSAGLDLVFFTIAFWLTKSVLTAVVVGRVSSLINFALNRRLVFRSRTAIGSSLWRYYLLALVLAAISYGAIRGLSSWLGWNIVVIKVGVESTLSLLSFSVQRIFVFNDDQRA